MEYDSKEKVLKFTFLIAAHEQKDFIFCAVIIYIVSKELILNDEYLP